MPALTIRAMLIWATAPVLQVLCVYLLYRRKLLNQFPFLASFLALQTINNVARFFCFRHFGPYSWWYYSVYWVGAVLSDFAVIAVLYEVFCAAFKPFAGLQDLSKMVFKWAAACIFLIGFVFFVTTPNSILKNGWLLVGINDFERIVRVMECALLVFLFLGAQHLGISKRNRVFGFALGFGLEAFLQLLVFSAAAKSHVSKTSTWSELVPIVYYIALLAWVAYLIQPEPARESLHIPVTSPLLRWNEVALALGHSGGQVALMNSEPFMPNVERMVEQVMQKEMFVERRQPRAV